MHTVAVIAGENVSPFELSIAAEVFGIERQEFGVPWYRFIVCAVGKSPIQTDSGFTINTSHTLMHLDEADTIIVPSWDPVEQPLPEEMLAGLRRAADRGARMVSFCTGAFALAAAGILDGHRVTTHWMWAKQMQEMYPEVTVDPGVLYIDDGQVFTSAGTAAGIDLSLYLVRRDYGAEVANMLARRMVVPPHRDGGQAQYVNTPLPAFPDTDPFAATLLWMEEHLDQELPVDAMAAQANMSPRTFARRFRDVTGTTPHQWLMRQRVLMAQRLLETTDDSVERIADQSGFPSAAMLRIHFQKVLRTSPLAYRRAFDCQKACESDQVAVAS
ncbi:MAG TPA: helix-turn-helix domain-containing protein [Candidatus Dormibacteraeota bacterium]|jgi:transcriptional regulator GlxA family with amidase domain|nr:helix-turn-helix domain-containing protein [Candidatus Dormibacteraeota bacterium]